MLGWDVHMAATASAPDRRWSMLTAVLLAVTGFVFGYIEVRVIQDGEPLIIPIAIILVLDLVLAGAIATTRRSWLRWPALTLLIVGLAGDLPHQLDPIVHPVDAEHLIVSVLATVIQIAAILAATAWTVTTWRAAHPGDKTGQPHLSG